MTVLLGAIASAIVIASRAVPDGTSPVEAVVQAGSAVDQIAGELHTATKVATYSSASIEFAVPDRDHDTTDETILYTWSGTAGDPLTRRYNDGPAATFVADVYEFDLTYYVRTAGEERYGEYESGEVLLNEQLGTSNLFEVTVAPNQWPGQYFHPALPAEAIAWSVTRFKISAARAGETDDGLVTVQLRTADANSLPTDTVLEGFPMVESDLDTIPTWREFFVSNASGLSPDDGLCLVVRHESSSGNACSILHELGGGDGLDSFALSTINGGSSWKSFETNSMLYGVWGTVTASSTQEVTVYYLSEINLALRAGSQASSRVETAVQLLNQPEVSGP